MVHGTSLLGVSESISRLQTNRLLQAAKSIYSIHLPVKDESVMSAINFSPTRSQLFTLSLS
jgi:hypothetical protein